MKKICKLLLGIILFIPIFVMADKTYEDGVKIANDYIYSMPNYSKYLVSSGDQKFGFTTDSIMVTAEGFSTGGFLSKFEYERTKINNSSWLSPGIQYWLIKDDNGPLAIDLDYKRGVDKSGVRVTEFVQQDAKVKGAGTITTPWEFVEGYTVRVGSTDRSKGTVSSATPCDNIYASSNTECDFTLTLNGKYDIDTKECESNKNGKFERVTPAGYPEDGKITYKVSRILGDFTCNINLGAGCYKLTFDDAGGSNGMGSDSNTKNIYYKYGSGWYKDSSCLTSADLNTIKKPSKDGFIYKGYRIEAQNLDVINDSNVWLIGVKDSRIVDNAVIKAQWEGKVYEVTLNANGGSNGTATVYEKYSSAWHSATPVSDANKITKITSPKKAGHSFLGFYIDTTQYIKPDGVLPTPTTFLGNKTLTANWKACEAGKYLNGNSCDNCPVNKYSNAEANANCTDCPSGADNNGNPFKYTSSEGSTKVGDCKITCSAGMHVATANKGCVPCTGNYTTSGNTTVSAGSTSSCDVPKVYKITLNRNGGSGGTSEIYVKYNTGWYSTSAASTSITSISIPSKSGVNFAGYYLGDEQIIDKNGNILSGKTTKFSSDNTLTARFAAGRFIFKYTGNFKVDGGSTYTGNHAYKNSWYTTNEGNWKISFLTGGTLTIQNDFEIDVFLVGGGAGGSCSYEYSGGCGGGGYTTTKKAITVSGTSYSITIGGGGGTSSGRGGTSSAFGFTAAGGYGGSASPNGSGGRGGSGGAGVNDIDPLCNREGHYGGNGTYRGGRGQGTTTCEFEQSRSGSRTDLSGCASGVAEYGMGGRESCVWAYSWAWAANSGGGGTSSGCAGFGPGPGRGQSGVVIIRNARK